MEFWGIALIIVLLYAKSLNYNYVIDDYVRREGYLWIVPTQGQDPKFYDTKPTWYYRAFMIGMHIVNSFLVYTLFGWQGALLFAVHPLSVWGVVWVTGNYYATTAYFVLISYFFITTLPHIIGIPVGLIFFFAALHSTADALTFPFFFLLTGNWLGCLTFIPLAIFFNQKRWKTGIKHRTFIVKGKRVESLKWEWRRPIFMTKVMGRYIDTFLFPMKTYYFGSWGERIREDKKEWDFYHSANREFWVALVLCCSVFAIGLSTNPTATLWFFVLMGIHSQFTILGQPFAQRYLYLPQIGLCVVVGSLLPTYAVFALAGFYACRTMATIPNWKCQEDLLTNEFKMNPERGSAFSAISQYYISRKKLATYPPWQVNQVAAYMRRAISLNPESWVIHMNFTAYLVMIGKIDEAIAANERTIELMKKYCTDRERPNIEGSIKQLAWLCNLRVEAKKQAKKAERVNRKVKG